MADLTARIKPKKSSTAGEVPQASDLEVAELAVNTADGKLFVKHTDNSIKEISGGGGGGGISSPAVGRYYDFPTKAADSVPTTTGSWSDRTNQIGLNKKDSNGVLLNYAKMMSLKTGDNVWFNFDSAGWAKKTLTSNAFYSTSSGGFYALNFGESITSYTTVQFAIQDPTLQDGMELEYVAANTQWEHTYGGRPKSRFAMFEYDTGSATASPSTGLFAFWSGSSYAINQTDFRGIFHGDRLLASPTSFDVKVYAGGSLVYDGTITSLANVNSNRATFQFGSNAWVANLVDGQLVEFHADTFDGGEYYASRGDVKVHDGVDFEAKRLFTYDMADVNGAPADKEILKYNSANGGYEPGLPLMTDNSDYARGRALFGSYTYNASSTSAPPAGQASDYSGSTWAVNVVDSLGVNHQTVLYAQTATTNVDVHVGGVFKVSTTLSSWANKNASRCTFSIGDDSWKTGLTGGELIEFYGEPFTFSEVASANGQVLAWNSALSAYQPTTFSASDLADVDTSPLAATAAQPYNTYESTWSNITQGKWGGNGISQASLYIHRLDANGSEFAPLAANGNNKTVQIRFQTSGTDYGWVTYVVNVSTISGDIKQMDMVSPSTHPAPPGNYTSVEVRTLAPVPATDGQVLTYVAANSKWEPATPAPASASAELYDLTDVGAAGLSGILMDFDGGNDSTTFTESTGKITSWTLYSTAKQSTAQVKYGVSSFSGHKGEARYIRSNNLIGTDAEAEFAIGTGDFTSEIWVFIPTGTATTFQSVFAVETSDGVDEVMRMAIRKEAASGSVDAFIFALGTGSGYSNAIVNLQNQALYSYDTWHHLAVSRSGSTLKAFVDGAEVASVSDSTDIGSVLGANLYLHIGRNVPGNGEYLDSYLDNLYIVNGTAKYTAAFTPGQAIASPIPPSDGQVLTYVAANNQWEPAGTSIQAASDFELNPGTFPYWATKEFTGTPSAGEWFANGSSVMRANPVDSNGTDWTAEMTALGTSGNFWYSTDALNWTQTTNSGGFSSLPSWFQFNLSPFNANSHIGGIYISFSDPASAPGAPLANGDILQWVAADSAFKPIQPAALQGAAVRAALGIGEYVDDAAAGTGGVASGAMYYNTTSSDYRLKT